LCSPEKLLWGGLSKGQQARTYSHASSALGKNPISQASWLALRGRHCAGAGLKPELWKAWKANAKAQDCTAVKLSRAQGCLSHGQPWGSS